MHDYYYSRKHAEFKKQIAEIFRMSYSPSYVRFGNIDVEYTLIWTNQYDLSPLLNAYDDWVYLNEKYAHLINDSRN